MSLVTILSRTSRELPPEPPFSLTGCAAISPCSEKDVESSVSEPDLACGCASMGLGLKTDPFRHYQRAKGIQTG